MVVLADCYLRNERTLFVTECQHAKKQEGESMSEPRPLRTEDVQVLHISAGTGLTQHIIHEADLSLINKGWVERELSHDSTTTICRTQASAETGRKPCNSTHLGSRSDEAASVSLAEGGILCSPSDDISKRRRNYD